MNNYIVDTHCHLDLIEQKGISFSQAVESAKKNNVKILQTICTRISELEKILKYTQNHDFIYASVGIHPCNVADERKVLAQEIVKICQENPKIIGIGETGLDYFHDRSAIDLQKDYFLEHIKASRETNLPLIIHSRDCDEDMAQILEEQQKVGKFPALLHCFSSSEGLAKKAIELGIYLSISGIVTFKNATSLQEIVKNLPLDLLLVETDSPYLAPTPYRGQINQPSYTKHVVDFIANLRGETPEKITQITTENFFRIFKKAQPL